MTPGVGPFYTQGPSFEQTLQRLSEQRYIPNFKDLQKMMIFEYFYVYLWFKPRSPRGWTTKQSYIPFYQHLSQVVLKKIFGHLLCISMLQARWDRDLGQGQHI